MLELTSTARKVLNDRYLLKDKQRNPVETVEDMFRRVAKAVSMAELDFPVELPASGSMDSIRQEQEDIFYNTMITMEFLPNTPTLINAGRSLGQLSACFVLPIEDNMRSIFNSVTNAALIHQSGGGTGFSFSNIRPRGAKVSTTGGQASGPLSFMQVYNTATDCVKQGGTRRGANMGCLRIDHPDILEFLDCKLDLTKFNNFNLSVSVTEEFMQAVAGTLNYHPSEPEDVWLFKWREDTRVDSEAYHYIFALRHNDEVYAYVDARYLWNKIVHNAWSAGEPGLLFIDKINKLSPTFGTENVESCNPCGEQPLLSYESCNLGSINLVKCINPETDNFDSEVLKRIVKVAVRFLDNVISVNKYPLDEIAETTLKYRKIGLGVMGWADTLYLLGLPYDSEKARTLGSEIMEIISTAAVETSIALAEVRGPFPKYEEIKYNCELLYGTPKPLRNAALTTIAPTGTLSIIAGVSSGIEPVFAPIVRRHILNDEDFLEEDKYFIQQLCHLLESNATTFDGFESRFREVCEYVSKTGSTRGILSAYENAILCSASDVTPMGHISMQDAFQKFTHNAISKTVNLPSSATKEDVALVYKVAYESSCKGVTVYRDGCRANQVMNIVKSDDKAASSTTPSKLAVSTEATQKIIAEVIAASPKVIRESVTTVAAGSSPDTEASPQSESTDKPGVRVGPEGFIIPRNREKKLSGETTCVKTGCGKLYVTINHDTYGVAEIFTSTSKGGGCTSQSEAAARLASIGLRAGIAPAEIISQLRGIRCPSALKRDGSECTSCPDAIAGCLREYYLHYPALSSSLMHIKDHAPSNSVLAQRDSKSQLSGETPQGICEFCGAQMAFESGCRVCYSCGNSHCG